MNYYCGKCKIHFDNSMGVFCPKCDDDKYLTISRGSTSGVVIST